MKPEWSVRTELQLEHCQSPITVCVCVCVCVWTEGNNKCVYVQPGRVMDKYTFNNSPVSQYRDRPAAVELAEGSRMDQRPSDHDRTHQYFRVRRECKTARPQHTIDTGRIC